MFNQLSSLSALSSIIAMKITTDDIILLTNQYQLLIYSKHTFQIVLKKQISSKLATRHIYENSFAISCKGDLYLSLLDSGKAVLLKYDESIKVIANINSNTKPISSAAFNNKATLLGIGGEDGKVFFYSLKDNKIVKSLKTRPDYISDIAFSDDGQFTIISSFNKTNTLYSFNVAKEQNSFFSDDVIEKSIFIENNTKIASICRNNKLLIYDIDTQMLYSSNFVFDEWPTTISKLNDKFILVATKGNQLYIIDYMRFDIFKTIELNNNGVVTLEIDSGRLYIGFIDGELKIIDILSQVEQFRLHLKLKKFDLASELIKNNIFLATDESVTEFDLAWPDILSDAKKLIINGKETDANLLVQAFFFDKLKEQEYRFCLGHIDDFNSFTQLIEEQKYVDAFILADNKEFLKKTKDFDSLEKHFTKIFHNAKLLFAREGNIQNIIKAKELLNKYTAVPSKKTLINNLITKHKIFSAAEKLIKERNFSQYFLLVKNNIFLQDEEIYNKVILIGNHTHAKLKIFEQENEYEKAIEVAYYLKDFLPLKKIMEETIISLQKKQFLVKKIQENDIAFVYNFILREPKFEIFIPFIKYHNLFLNLIAKSHEYAKIGDLANLKKMLNKYIKIKYTIHLVAQEFKLAYLAEIEQIMSHNKSESIDWLSTLQLYETIFGIDNELIYTSDRYELSNYISQLQNSNRFDGYLTIDFPDSIIVRKLNNEQ